MLMYIGVWKFCGYTNCTERSLTFRHFFVGIVNFKELAGKTLNVLCLVKCNNYTPQNNLRTRILILQIL